MQQKTRPSNLRTMVIGTVAGPLARRSDRHGQSTLGAVVADALQAGAESFGTTTVALLDPADLQGDLPLEPVHDIGGSAGTVTASAALLALPLSYTSTVVSLTGAQLVDALERQFATARSSNQLMQVSHSLSYRWTARPSNGRHVEPASVTVNSAPVDSRAGYSVVISDTLRALHGNPVLRCASPVAPGLVGVGGARSGPLFDNLVAYLSTRRHLPVPEAGRITRND